MEDLDIGVRLEEQLECLTHSLVVGWVDLLRYCVIESKWLVEGHDCCGELWMEWGMASSIYGVSDRLLSREERCLGLVDVPLEVSVFSREYG